MFLVSLKNSITVLYMNAYRKVTLITTDKTPNIGITVMTLYNASGGDESMAIEDFSPIYTIVIPLDNLAGFVEWDE